MSSRSAEVWPLALLGGALIGGGLLVAFAGRRETDASGPTPAPSLPPPAALPRVAPSKRPDAPPHPAAPTATPAMDLNVEAAARMLASENPRGSEALHVEQVWTQLRAKRPGQSLYDRITAGSGWGPQGQRAGAGKRRPVSTVEPATDALRTLVREILDGKRPSQITGARKFFEPAAQDRAFAAAEAARRKQKAGLPLSEKESRLLGYKRTAAQVRAKWTGEGARLLGSLEGVEFYS